MIVLSFFIFSGLCLPGCAFNKAKGFENGYYWFMLTISKNTNCFKVHLDVEPGPCVYCSKHDISKRYIHLQQRVSDAPEFYKLVSDNFNISENVCVCRKCDLKLYINIYGFFFF